MFESLYKNLPKWFPIVLFGAFGGIAPTLIKLATALVTHPEQPMPLYAFYIGLALYALIGGVLAGALEETDLRGALFAGIAAPALISSAITGSQPAAPAPANVAEAAPLIISSALAAEVARTAIGPAQRKLVIQAGPTDVPLAVNVCVPAKPGAATAGATKCAQQQTVVASPAAPQTVVVPADAKSVSIAGKAVPLNSASQPVGVTVKSQPTLWQDFVWALGGSRQAEITGVKTSPVPGK